MQSQTLPTMVLIVIYSFTLAALVLFLITLQEAFKKCSPASRTMQPGKVWLWLIPLFGLVWQFIVVLNLAESLANEFARIGISIPKPAPGRSIGVAFCICNCFLLVPRLGGVAGLVGLVLWIVYWVRIASYSRQLDSHRVASPALPTA